MAELPPKTRDITGQKFNYWTVISFSHKAESNNAGYWNCKCKCGTERSVRSYALTSGKSKSCGCLQKETSNEPQLDLTGNIYGSLKVISLIRPIGLYGWMWNVECICGTKKQVLGNNLKQGKTKSCGCSKKGISIESFWKNEINSYKRSAKNRNFEWNITDELAKEIMQFNCIYCGSAPSQNMSKAYLRRNITFKRNGIDRIDSSKGYIEGNVVSCCASCNYKKGSKTVDEFLDESLAIYNHSIKGTDRDNNN